MATGIIYLLCDASGEGRYVGQTTRSLAKRLREHISFSETAKRNYKNSLIKSILSKNEKPTIQKLQELDVNDLDEAEIYWIAFLRKEGFRLVNSTSGGAGGGRNPSFETRLKMSVSQKTRTDRKHSEETKNKIRASTTGLKRTEETCKRIQAAGKMRSDLVDSKFYGKVLTKLEIRRRSKRDKRRASAMQRVKSNLNNKE